MKQKSIKKNALLMSIKTIASLILPLITFPYVSRILGAEELGRYNFANSIVSYFVLIAGLGINTYAIREGSKIRNTREKLSEEYSEIYLINIFSAFFSIVLLLLALVFVPKLFAYRTLILILGTQVLLTTFGRTWVFNVFEEFGIITLIQLCFNIVSLFALLLFVKKPGDVAVYTIVQVISLAGSNVIYGFLVKKYVSYKRINLRALKKHIKPIMIIFGTSVATTIYVNSDITILGWLINDKCVGIYSVSVKIYSIIKQVMVVVITVAIPRLSLYAATEEFKELFKKTFNMLLVVTLPAATGLIMTSHDVILLISGPEYIEATLSLQLLSIALIFALVACLFGMGVLLPYMKEKIFLYSTIVSAVVNIILNLILIPAFEQNAAAFTTIVSQLFAFIICFCFSKKHVSLRGEFKYIISLIIGCAFIIPVCLFVDVLCLNLVLTLAIKVFASVFVYITTLIIFKNEIIIEMINSTIKRINDRFH